MIAPGLGLELPAIGEPLWQFSPLRNAGAQFAANLLRARIASPANWAETCNIGAFLQRTLEGFVGNRAAKIDTAFDVAIYLGTTPSNWRDPEDINPQRILLTLRVAHTVGWVNLTPALDLLQAEHELLPTLFYHWLNESLSRWFRVFDVQEARFAWESWMEMRDQDKAEREEACRQQGIAYEPTETLKEPTLPACIGEMPTGKLPDLRTLTRSKETAGLMRAAEQLHRISRGAICPKFDPQDREDLFSDSDHPFR